MAAQASTIMDHFKSDQFATRVQNLMKQWHVPGLSIAISHNEQDGSRAFGFADLESRTAFQPDTLIDVASSSKSFTAASVANLIENEEYPAIQWDAVMSKVLPGFVMSERVYTDNVTIEDILCHRSGLPRHDSSALGSKAEHPDNAHSTTLNLRNLPVAAPLRTKFMYNNLMYTVATDLVEHVSGMTFEKFLQTKFWQPLGMKSTYLQPDSVVEDGQISRRATGHFYDKEKDEYVRLEHLQSPEAQGAGSIYSTAPDYLIWAKALMKGTGPVTEGLRSAMLKPRMLRNPDADEEERGPLATWEVYSTGLEISFYRGIKVVAHDGLFYGFSSVHMFVPSQKFACVIFANSEGAYPLVEVLRMELLDEVLGVPQAERPDHNAKWVADMEKDDHPEEDERELREKLLKDADDSAQLPLSDYVGRYWNAGYRGFDVQIREDRLYVYAGDRSMPFTLDFYHVRGQSYIVRLLAWPNGDLEFIEGQFKLKDGRVTALGINMEEDAPGLTWFERVEEKSTLAQRPAHQEL